MTHPTMWLQRCSFAATAWVELMLYRERNGVLSHSDHMPLVCTMVFV